MTMQAPNAGMFLHACFVPCCCAGARCDQQLPPAAHHPGAAAKTQPCPPTRQGHEQQHSAAGTP
jgi:hypothetical protein